MAATMPGITFRETMAGPFALGETDPEAGRRAGARQRTTLSMHVTVTVRDLDRFLSDPEHRGTLAGTIDFPPLGRDLPVGRGIFRLFSPGAGEGSRRMGYELAIDHGGARYCLVGHKEVRDDSGPDAWRDLTTLFTRLHRGEDSSGPVVGAGVLSLGMREFARVLGSLRAIDTDSTAEGAALLARFGRFFAGQVWERYAPHVPLP